MVQNWYVSQEIQSRIPHKATRAVALGQQVEEGQHRIEGIFRSTFTPENVLILKVDIVPLDIF